MKIVPAIYVLIRVKTIWPAVMFAASRNDSVIGWTNVLVVSVSTKNGFSHSGAPSGRKWAIVFFGSFSDLDRIIVSHIGSPSDRVNRRCLEDLNEYGVIPIRLIVIIIVNRIEMISISPFMWIE